MNPTQKSILERRSTRGFSPKTLQEKEKEMLMEAALASPSAVNYQDWHFSFIYDQALLRQFSSEYRKLLIEEKDTYENSKYDVFFGAPLVVFISLPEAPLSLFASVEAGIAVENLALSAQGMGLGSVIIGRPKQVFDIQPEWEGRFHFPQGNHFAIGIAIGQPITTKGPHPVKEGKISVV